MSLLMQFKNAEFNLLLEKTEASKGNLSTQLKKLEEAKYIKINKTFRKNYPLTKVEITNKGRKAFEDYFDNLKSYYNF